MVYKTICSIFNYWSMNLFTHPYINCRFKDIGQNSVDFWWLWTYEFRDLKRKYIQDLKKKFTLILSNENLHFCIPFPIPSAFYQSANLFLPVSPPQSCLSSAKAIAITHCNGWSNFDMNFAGLWKLTRKRFRNEEINLIPTKIL